MHYEFPREAAVLPIPYILHHAHHLKLMSALTVRTSNTDSSLANLNDRVN